ncbi:MAG: hypothetical protein AB7K68_08795 [Bacteriovoracia bacterium]
MGISLFVLLLNACFAKADSSAEIVRYLGTAGAFGQQSISLLCADGAKKCRIKEMKNAEVLGQAELESAEAEKILGEFKSGVGKSFAAVSNPALSWSLHYRGENLFGSVSRKFGNSAATPSLMKLELELRSRLK